MSNPDDGLTDDLAVSRRTMLKGVASTGVVAATDGALAGGTTDVVVRADDVDVPLVQSASRVDELKAEAEASQQPIVEYVEATDALAVRNRFWLTNALLVRVDTSVVSLDDLAAQNGVKRVHPNYEFHTPDPDTTASASASGETTYGLDLVDAPAAWEEFGTRGDGAKVAVLDTGVDISHPDLSLFTEDASDPTYPGGWAEFDQDGEQVEGSTPRDTSYHGSHVSGTVAGGDASGTQIGVAPDVELLHGLTLPEGSGSFAQIIGAMQWAVEADADVINMSLGATGYFGEMIDPVRNAEAAGTVVVCAAGNSGEGTSGSPGNVFDSFAVGAADENRDIADFSSGEEVNTLGDWGLAAPDDWPSSYVVPDASAPGVDVTSSVPSHADFSGQYTELSGTSMASPHVAGLAGLMVAASSGSFEPTQYEAALRTTASKPSDAPAERDTRYGEGIVDAVAAIGRVAADGGVTGTVVDADGNPVSGATVALDGFPTETDADGSFRLRATPGEYELAVEAFGYATRTTTVQVPDGFTTQEFVLADALAVDVLTPPPEGVEAGGSFEYDLRVDHVEALTVERGGDYTGDVTLTLDGDSLPVGERVAFDSPLAGTVTVEVSTAKSGSGELALDHDFEGLGELQEVTTGPTAVYEGPVRLGVVDVETGAFGTDLVAMLDGALPPRFRPELVHPPDLLAAVDDGTYDAYLVQNLGDDADLVREFAEATRLPGTGVVYLDQFGDASDAISQLAAATGDPEYVTDAFVQAPTQVPIYYELTADHPIFDGFGDYVELYAPAPILFYSGFHTYFEGYDGAFDAATVADTSVGGLASGGGLAVDDLSRTVLASSLGLSTLVTRSDLTDGGKAVLANAVEFAAETPPVVLLDTQERRVDPGESAGVRAAVEELESVTVDLADEATLAASDVTLRFDGETVAPGETVTFDEPLTGEVTISAETAAGAVGLLALDLEFETREPEGTLTTQVTTGPTSVYSPPLRVPEDVGRINDAVGLVVPDGEIVVGDGTYREEAVDGFQAGVLVDKPGVTVRAAAGADPVVLASDDLFVANAITVDADDVTIEGLTVNLVDGESDKIGQGIRINPRVAGTTVRDATAGGTSGVFLDEDVADVTVENLTAVDTPAGVGTDFYGGPVNGLTVTGLTLDQPNDIFGLGGVYVTNATDVTVEDCDITFHEDYTAGIYVFGPFEGGENCVVRNNTLTGPGLDQDDPYAPERGVYLDTAETVVEDNVIEGAHTGVRVGDLGFGEQPVHVRNNEISGSTNGLRLFGDYTRFADNAVEAETGVFYDGGYFGLAADAAKVRFNDLSATDTPFAGSPSRGWGDPDGPFDARLNYVGDRDYGDAIADGEIVYGPFLTAPPAEVDHDAPTSIATDLYLDPGETHALGVPGATDDTLWELLGATHPHFDGTVEFWNATAGKWQDVTGQGELAQLDSLSAFRVTPNAGVRSVLDFQRESDTPSGLRDSSPGEIAVDAGWNFVAAPAYGGDDVFADGTATVEAVETRDLTPPRSQLGDDDATRSAFTGYFVKADSAGTIETDLDAYDPTMPELYRALGLDPVIHDAFGPGAAPGSAALPSVADVLDAVPEDEAADAVTDLLGATVGDALADAADDAASATVVGDALRDATAGARRSDAVETATGRVLRLALGADAADEDDTPRTADAAADASGQSTSQSLVGGALSSLLGD